MSLRTLHLIDGLGPGGAERSLAELVVGLRDRGITPTIAVLEVRTSVHEEVLDSGVEVVHVPGTRLQQLRVLRWLLRDVDVLHTTLYNANLVGRLAAASRGVPVLTSLVNTTFSPGRLAAGAVTPWKLEVVRLGETLLGRLPGRYHAISQDVADHHHTALGIARDRITVVPRGRDRGRLGKRTAERRAAARAALGIGPDTPVVLTVGRQDAQKAQWVLVEAMAAVREQHPDAQCLVAGREGTSSDRVRDAIDEHGVQDAVRLLGDRDDVGDLLCAADVFVMPSLYEGFGGAVLEAMLLACPIVASDVPGLREVLAGGEVATLVPPDDAAALAAGILGVLAQRPQARVAAAAERAATAYDQDVVLDRMAALLAECAGQTAALTAG